MKARVICMLMLAVLTLGVVSCDQGEYPTYYLTRDFTDYVMFREGSFWVYDQQGNTRLDSVYVYQQGKELNETRRAVAYNFEEFFQNMSSSYYKDTLIGRCVAARLQDEQVFFVYTEGYLSNAQERNLQFYTNHEIGTTLDWTESTSVKYVDSLATYTVNRHQYSDVKVFESTVLRGPLMTSKVYYARGVGVIRKELSNGQVWNLTRHKVKQ